MSLVSATSSLMLQARLLELAKVQAAAPAVIQAQRLWTYEQLHESCQGTAHALVNFNIQAGDVVALLAYNCVEFICTLVACDTLGAIFMPLNWRLAGPELAAQLQDAQAKVLLHDEACQLLAQATLKLCGDHLETKSLAQLAVTKSAANITALPDQPYDPNKALLLVYTSGTTGKPKGALHSCSQLIANARASWDAHDLTPSDRVLTALPLFHVGGLCIQTLPALLVGACVYLHTRFDANAFLQTIEREKITVALLVPPVMQSLIHSAAWLSTDISSVKIMMAGSSIVPTALLKQFHQRGIPVGQVYGATETGPVTVVLKREHVYSRVGYCGWPAKSVQVKLLDAIEGIGELAVKGPNVMIGYKDSPPLANTDKNGWHATGDLAQMESDGCIRIVGRARDLIISGGENIHPVQIEQELMQIPGIAECCVIGVPDPHWGEVVIAALVSQGTRHSDEQLNQILAKQIARFKLPRRYVWLSELPKSALGKVLKDELKQQIERIVT
jgi:fatty-acyl-CoA synthase